MWLFLQQRCKIFVAIWQVQKNKPPRGLIFLFASITTIDKRFCVILSDNNGKN